MCSSEELLSDAEQVKVKLKSDTSHELSVFTMQVARTMSRTTLVDVLSSAKPGTDGTTVFTVPPSWQQGRTGAPPRRRFHS